MRDEIKIEITGISAVIAAIGNSNYYETPTGYFIDFADEVMSKIQLPPTQMPLTGPAPFYFESLADTILMKIKSKENIFPLSEVDQELKELSPFLADITKINVYSVPENYFSSLHVDTAAIPEPAKPILLYKPVKWLRYAVAAAIAGIVVTGGVLFSTSRQTNQFAFSKNYGTPLSKLSNDAITSYLQTDPEDIDALPPLYDNNKQNAVSLTQDLLNNVSDRDIQQYLKENAEPGENDIKGI